MAPGFKFSACFFAREKGLVMMMRSEASQLHGARLQVFSVQNYSFFFTYAKKVTFYFEISRKMITFAENSARHAKASAQVPHQEDTSVKTGRT